MRHNSLTAIEGISDLTGYAYTNCAEITGTLWGAGGNAYADFTSKRAVTSPPQSDIYTSGGYSVGGDAAWYRDNGADRRMVVIPVVPSASCVPSSSPPAVAPLDWACVLMLSPFYSSNSATCRREAWIEYRGRASDITAGCSSSGLPGGPSAGGPRVPALVQ